MGIDSKRTWLAIFRNSWPRWMPRTRDPSRAPETSFPPAHWTLPLWGSRPNPLHSTIPNTQARPSPPPLRRPCRRRTTEAATRWPSESPFPYSPWCRSVLMDRLRRLRWEIPTTLPFYSNNRRMGVPGGWEQQFGWEQQADGRSQLQQDSPVLPWLENTAQGGQRRRVLPPNSAAATASNPFLDVCSGIVPPAQVLWFDFLRLSQVLCVLLLWLIVLISSRTPSAHRTLFTLFQFQDMRIKDLYISDSQKVTNLVGLKSSPPSICKSIAAKKAAIFFMQKAAAVGESKEYTLTKSCNVWTNSCQAKHTTNML